MAGAVVETTAGKIRGASKDGVHRFLGVPYGADTSGRRRFRPAAPPPPWTGEREATRYGPAAPQPIFALGSPDRPSELMQVLGAREPEAQSEDCLLLNLWTPSLEGADRPVLVWLHGGGHTVGSGRSPMYDGQRLAARGDAVVVTLNHRLGAPGFLYLAELAGPEFADSGMVGILDIQHALEWVRHNISAFGGDPANVTIFGESGGGAKVSTLLGMPGARGLFHRAIVQSGPMVRGIPREQAREATEKILAELGLAAGQIDALQTLPIKRLTDAQEKVMGGALGGGLFGTGVRLGPVVDGRSLPAHPFDPVAAEAASGVPLLIGSNKDEMTLFLDMLPNLGKLDDAALRGMLAPVLGERAGAVVDVYRRTRPRATPGDLLVAIMTDRFRVGSIRLAERKAAGRAPVYMYLFSYETDILGGRLRSPHALEIPFVFDVVDAVPLTGTRPDRQRLADRMSEAWLAFARSGDPNHAGLPTWPAYTARDRATLVFDSECRVDHDPSPEERRAWDGIPPGL
jgi:para-nitrobenzyl esterase